MNFYIYLGTTTNVLNIYSHCFFFSEPPGERAIRKRAGPRERARGASQALPRGGPQKGGAEEKDRGGAKERAPLLQEEEQGEEWKGGSHTEEPLQRTQFA